MCDGRMPNVSVLTVKDYVAQCPSEDIVHDLFEQLENKESGNDGGRHETGYSSHLSVDMMDIRVKALLLHKGALRVRSAVGPGYVRSTTTGETILIPDSRHANRAIHLDIVGVEVLPESQWQTPKGQNVKVMTGRVVGVFERNWRPYVCSLPEDYVEEVGKTDRWQNVLCVPMDPKVPKLRVRTQKAGKLSSERFIVHLDSWETSSQYPNGHVVRSLGRMGELETETDALLTEHNSEHLPFSKGSLRCLPEVDYASRGDKLCVWSASEDELSKRRDLRGGDNLIMSIDPPGCEDIDDALSAKVLKNGNYQIGVHIADVTHFVEQGSLLDMEARSRGTTVYMVDRRYDMLPSLLSADLCSLHEKRDRYAVSTIWEFSKDMKIVSSWYGRTVIKSSHALAYAQAQSILEGGNGDLDVTPAHLERVRESVRILTECARKLKRERALAGALDLESAELKFILDAKADPTDVQVYQEKEVNQVVAEWMIFANSFVAKTISDNFPTAALLRRHPYPKQEDFDQLKACANAKGQAIDVSSNKALALSLSSFKSDPDAAVEGTAKWLATRAMAEAQYFATGQVPTDEFFHFGLALDYYTHFTFVISSSLHSPSHHLVRHPDVVVHRLLLCGRAAKYNANDVALITDHINEKNRSSKIVQREGQHLFLAIYLQKNHEGFQDVDAVIFSVEGCTLRLYVNQYGLKGKVDLSNFSDNFTSTPTSVTVVVENKSYTYSIFDHVDARVTVKTSRFRPFDVDVELPCVRGPKDPSKIEKKQTSKMSKSEIPEYDRWVKQQGQSKSGSPKEASTVKSKQGVDDAPTTPYRMFRSLKALNRSLAHARTRALLKPVPASTERLLGKLFRSTGPPLPSFVRTFRALSDAQRSKEEASASPSKTFMLPPLERRIAKLQKKLRNLALKS